MTVKGTASSNLALSAKTREAALSHWILDPTKCKHCGKVSYQSREDAVYATKAMLEEMTPYECFYGNGWHLATKRKVLLHGRQPLSKSGA